jgi:predicted NAD/FAD-dependent oxidoreductase
MRPQRRFRAMKSSRVGVIGAGVAGLTAARSLARAGCDVRVFEKARGVGGRTSTRRSQTTAFDHGAQYFTCRTQAFTEQVEDWCRRGVAAAWGAPIKAIGGGSTTATREESRRYVGVPGMSALARDLAKGLDVECGRRIARIEGSAEHWMLIAEDGAKFPGFDAVVVATPAPQAVPLLAPAPRLAELVSGVEMQPCHAVLATLPHRLDIDFGGAFVSESALAWVARTASKPGRPGAESWVLHAGPEWSARHLEEPAEDVAQSLLGAFGDAMGRELPTPNSCSTHLWRFARTTQALGKSFLWDADQRLAVCGDWTHGARVEDAFTSGKLLSRAMLGEQELPASQA